MLKYLESYKDYSVELSQKEIRSQIKDILLELQDDGFLINIGSDIIIRKIDWEFGGVEYFKFSEVKEYIKRLKDFLGNKFIKYTTYGKMNGYRSTNKHKLIDRLRTNRDISSIVIKYDDMPLAVKKIMNDILKGR